MEYDKRPGSAAPQAAPQTTKAQESERQIPGFPRAPAVLSELSAPSTTSRPQVPAASGLAAGSSGLNLNWGAAGRTALGACLTIGMASAALGAGSLGIGVAAAVFGVVFGAVTLKAAMSILGPSDGR